MLRKNLKKGYHYTRYYLYKETLIDAREHFWSFIGAFAGIGLIAFIQSRMLPEHDNIFLIGSFGASAVLVFGAIQSPLSQPRNLIGGHVISALIGVAIQKIFPDILWLSAPLAVASSIVIMQMSKTLHPPGGATALIAVIGGEKIRQLGFAYALFPVFSGAFILLIVALVVNNMTKNRVYPIKNTIVNKLEKDE